MTVGRDYSLTGADGRLARERGLASAEWYASPIPRKRMKELMQRSDQPALRDTAIWLGVMALCGGLGAWLWGSWVGCCRSSSCYGVLYGSASDSRWHECGHGTAFKTRWMNDVVYQIASFMIMREPTVWRWSHARHHTDTLIVGRDPEIVAMRPPRLAQDPRQLLRPGRRAARLPSHVPARRRPAHGRGGDLHPGDGAAQGLPDRPHLAGDLRRDRRRCASPWARSCRRCSSACRGSMAPGTMC